MPDTTTAAAPTSFALDASTSALLIDEAPIGLWLADAHGALRAANAAFLALLDLDPACATGPRWLERFPAPERERLLRQLCAQHATPTCFETILVLQRAGDSARELRVRTNPIVTGGVSDGFAGILEDVTTQRREERRARQEAEQKIAVLQSVSSILIHLDRDDRITCLNAFTEKLLSLSSEAALGRRLDELGLNWQGERIQAAIDECKRLRTPVRVDKLRYVDGQGQQGLLGITLHPVLRGAQDVGGVLLQGADVTAAALREAERTQAQKLESIGQLASGIAHEINTPIQFVADNTRFLKDGFADLHRLSCAFEALLETCRRGAPHAEALVAVDELRGEIDLAFLTAEIPRAIDEALEGIDRVARIVHAMKEFSHPQSAEPQMADLARAIESTITVTRNEWKYVAELSTDFDASLPAIPCLPGELNQVFLNIIVNAAQAIEDAEPLPGNAKGTITIRTLRNDPWAEVHISDTGCGIPDEIRSKIFDPFFTTKEVGRGTGQGLAIARSVIVDKHAGTLTVESARGRGTTFVIRLPLGGRAAKGSQDPA